MSHAASPGLRMYRRICRAAQRPVLCGISLPRASSGAAAAVRARAFAATAGWAGTSSPNVGSQLSGSVAAAQGEGWEE
ncbi:UNVERIFIED_CONTAM: hypothetical protein K2H54_067921 [Gekko kuhli]